MYITIKSIKKTLGKFIEMTDLYIGLPMLMIFLVLFAFTNLKINSNIAMTGEITLRGNVLGIGGLKEKVMGAKRNNIKTIFIPYENLSDLDDIPNEIKEDINFILVNNYMDIYKKIGEL